MLKTLTGLCLLLLYLCLSPVQAATPSHSACFIQAGRMYQIDPLLLEAIARRESSLNPRAINTRNRNGTSDYGMMQVNSGHLPVLKKKGIIRSHRDLFDPCLNIQIGAWLLAQHFKVCGVNWNCLGSYNAGFRASRDRLRESYADKVYAIYRQLNHERRNTPLR